MPIYQYQCKKCESIFETLATMTEDYEDPATHCPKCDPDHENEEGTLFKYLGNCRPAFNLKGGEGRGFFKPGWQ
jgi:putative FmdB family regulatory protein|tara:strand:+ start:1132 stop:1353 length:222 start_codon:yes stop_codon:yes gene_type:complete